MGGCRPNIAIHVSAPVHGSPHDRHSRESALLSGENEVLQKCAGIAPRVENFPWKFSAIGSSCQRKLESSAFADFQVAGFQLSLE
jgi:hypothetical protein